MTQNSEHASGRATSEAEWFARNPQSVLITDSLATQGDRNLQLVLGADFSQFVKPSEVSGYWELRVDEVRKLLNSQPSGSERAAWTLRINEVMYVMAQEVKNRVVVLEKKLENAETYSRLKAQKDEKSQALVAKMKPRIATPASIRAEIAAVEILNGRVGELQNDLRRNTVGLALNADSLLEDYSLRFDRMSLNVNKLATQSFGE